MWIKDKLTQFQERRARNFLRNHTNIAVNLLRNDNELASRAVEKYWDMQAARGDAPSRETYSYPSLNSLGIAGQSSLTRTIPKPSNYMLRVFSEKPPVRRAINALENPILDLPFKITVRRPLSEDSEATPQPTDDQQRRIRAATSMLEMPNDELNGREFLEMVLEDILVLGGGAVEVQENSSDDRPLFLWPVDAQSIRINAAWRPGENIFRYSQGRGYFYSAIGTTDQVKLCDNELMYIKLNPRTSSPFGYGYAEVAFDVVNAFLGGFDFATRRASNSTPQFGIFLGENVTSDQAARFRSYWENEIEGYGKIPIVAGGRQPSVFQFAAAGTDPLWLQWQEWLIRLIAMAFGLSPMKLGVERDVNRSTATVQQSDDWATISPVANLVRDYYTYWLLWKRLGWNDLEYQWVVKNQDDMKQAQVIAEQWNADNLTVDEARRSYNRPPLSDGMGAMTKTAYQAYLRAAAKAAFPVAQPQGGFGDSNANALVTPFDDEDQEEWSPEQRAVVREIVRNEKIAAG